MLAFPEGIPSKGQEAMKKWIDFIQRMPKVRLSDLYHLVVKSTEVLPKLSVIETPNGCFSGVENDYIFQQAVRYGTNEFDFVDFIQHILSSTSVAVDLGANIGTHSVAMAKLASSGRIFAFEAQSLTFSILQNNLLLNKCRNVTAYRFAVSNENHRLLSMQPFTFSAMNINNGDLKVDLSGTCGDLVLSRTLDSFDFDQLDFIKLDIQGSEVRAIEGAVNLIGKYRPFLFVEIEEQHLRAMGASTKELIELVLSLDYAIYRLETVYPCDHICVPREKVDHFEGGIAPKLQARLSQRVYGSRVEVQFKKDSDQNYFHLNVS